MKKTLINIAFICAFLFHSNAQTTVITHGFSAGGADQTQGWMLDMANAIRNRIGDATIRVYNHETGNFDYMIGSGTQTILLYDWAAASDNFQAGFSEDAGAALFTSLIKGYLQNDFDISILHLIGHSRGTAVNSEAAERLLVAGFSVAQVTSLDAHDWGAVTFFDDYDVNPSEWNSGIEGWAGLEWADSYWQESLLTLNGRPVEGTFQVDLGTIGHSEVHEWYTETIIDSNRQEGYYYSINGQGFNNRPPRTGLQRQPAFTFQNDGLLNGDFERGTFLNETFAGWSYNGGNGNATIDANYLGLTSAGACNKISNRFFIPENATSITFEYFCFEPDTQNLYPFNDRLIVLLDHNLATQPIYLNQVSQNWIQVSFPITQFTNSIHTLEFRLTDENGADNDLNAEVGIDNIQLIIDPTASINNIVFNNNKKLLFSIYPNPAVNHTNIEINSERETVAIIDLLDSKGMKISTLNQMKLHAHSKQYYRLNTQDLTPGMYFIQIKTTTTSQIKKLLVFH